MRTQGRAEARSAKERDGVVVYAPASIGNVGVGFDTLGAAVSPADGSLLGDRVHVGPGPVRFSLEVVGPYAAKLPSDPGDNIVSACWRAFERALELRGRALLDVHITLEKGMPIASGLGSSACSIVAALEALNRYHEAPLSRRELLHLMAEMEARISGSLHYDNVAPSYFGGLQLMFGTPDIICQEVPLLHDWYWVIAYPGTQVSTAAARAVLPTHYARQDVIDHGRHLAAFIHACHGNQSDLAARMVKDLIAEPYRQGLLPGFSEARTEATKMGALAIGISGSGPTLFSLCSDEDIAQELTRWLTSNYLATAEGFVHICRLDRQGARPTGTTL